MSTDLHCYHCGKPVVWSGSRWQHERSGSAFCATEDQTTAYPERLFNS